MDAVLKPAEQADLHLRFAKAPDGRTYVNHQFCRYPFHICRVQYVDPHPEGLATVYLQSSAGGIFAYDRLSSEFHSLPGSQSHITTQASTIVHSMDDGLARSGVVIRAEADSFLEYMPDPMILFPKSQLCSTVVVQIHPSATALLADAFTAHDPSAGEETFTEYRSEVRVENLDGRLLCLDRFRATGIQCAEGQPGVMGENKVQGTFMVLDSESSAGDMCELLRGSLPPLGVYAGVSALPNGCGVWVRLVAADASALRSATQELWAIAREALLGERPHNRRK